MMNMTSGIYLYYDTKKNTVVYVGRDSNIDKKIRHKYHMAKYNYDKQSINSILQNNPDRYEYRVYCEGIFSNEELNNLEIQTIKLFDTFHRKDAFNYTEGGEGRLGLSGENNPRWKDYARVIKRGIHRNGKQEYALKYDGKYLAYSIYKEKLEKLADEINKDENKVGEIIKKIPKDYARVVKNGTHSNGKQNYALIHNGKIIKRSIYKEKLEKLAEEINNKNKEKNQNDGTRTIAAMV